MITYVCFVLNLQINELFQTVGSLSSAGECPQRRHTLSVTFVGAFVIGHSLVTWVSQGGRRDLTHCTSTKTFTHAADPCLMELALTLLAGTGHSAVSGQQQPGPLWDNLPGQDACG